METVLDTAHTWFLEAYTQLPSGELRIRLAEGIKATERLPVQIVEKTLGSFFPITVEPTSRVVEVRFPLVLVLFTYNESYETGNPEFVAEDHTVLRKVKSSSFKNYATANTMAFELSQEPVTEWLLWTEDQVFQVLASGDPQLIELPTGPNLSIERGQTWAAN